jgi:hypothetical protein
MFIHSAKPRLGFALLMCALLGFSLSRRRRCLPRPRRCQQHCAGFGRAGLGPASDPPARRRVHQLHTYTGRPGSTLEGILTPRSDTKIDLVIKIYSPADVKNALATFDTTDVGKGERFTLILS